MRTPRRFWARDVALYAPNAHSGQAPAHARRARAAPLVVFPGARARVARARRPGAIAALSLPRADAPVAASPPDSRARGEVGPSGAARALRRRPRDVAVVTALHRSLARFSVPIALAHGENKAPEDRLSGVSVALRHSLAAEIVSACSLSHVR